MNRSTKLGIGLGALTLLLLTVVLPGQPDAPPVEFEPAIANFTSGMSIEDRVAMSTRNLSFEKENRTLAAAKNLGRLGAAARSAIPTLEKFIAERANDTGELSERQLEAFRDALEKIRSAPPEGKIAPSSAPRGEA